MKALGNLPYQLTSFIGRDAAVAMVGRRLPADRLVTLVGPGGSGKTRLALEVGRTVAELRPHGVFFVDLSGVSEPELVPNCVLQVLGLRSAPGQTPSRSSSPGWPIASCSLSWTTVSTSSTLVHRWPRF